MIEQTRIGKILCALGLHQLVQHTIAQHENPWSFSIVGGCVRCNHSFQWDN